MTTILRANENLKEKQQQHLIKSIDNSSFTSSVKINMGGDNSNYKSNNNTNENNNNNSHNNSSHNNGSHNNNDNNKDIDINSMNINNDINYSCSNNTITIFDIPIEILFHIFTIDSSLNYYNINTPIQINCRNLNNNNSINNNSNNNEINLINYNSYNKNQIIKMIINFSKTCKYFEELFQDDRFWYKSYKDYFSNYSLVDIDENCLSNPNYAPISTTPINTSPISPSTMATTSSTTNNNNKIDNNNINNYIYNKDEKKINQNQNNNIDENEIEIKNNNYSNNINNQYNNINNQNNLNDITDINYKANLWKSRFIKRNHPWNLNNLNLKKEIQQSKGITSLEVDNNYLFSGSHDTNINLYSLDDLKSRQVFRGHESTIWALKSDGKRLYSGSNDHTIRIWDLKSNKCKSIIRDNTKIFSIALKDKLIISSSDNNIKVWNRKLVSTSSASSLSSSQQTQQQPLVTTLRGSNGGVNTIELKDYNLYSGSSDGTIGIWDLNQMKQVSFKIDPVDKILSLKVVNSNTLVTGSQNCQIKFWDIRQSNRDSPIASLINAHKWEVWQLEMCGGYLFSGSFDHTIKVWDLNNFKNLKTISSHRSYIHALTSSSFNLFSGSADRFIKVWKSDN